MDAPSYRGFRFPAEVISHCVWLYHRFNLSLRDVEELMLERGIEVSYETIHQWTRSTATTVACSIVNASAHSHINDHPIRPSRHMRLQY